ncbi:Haloacid dehalogenase-like hydrolase-domain-containing protein [Phyllosticta capitalensis]|uniref:Haloacid dehalogenase-like hydrolase-domain-containing protein n=1 Tax=Phyllosticta capitalensis TaxID=121624 RepID=UPI00312FF33C
MPTTHPLTHFEALTFDVYGTLIDWETGIYTALSPLLDRLHALNHAHPYLSSRSTCLRAFVSHESAMQASHPDLPYPLLLGEAYKAFAAQLPLDAPSESEVATFGASVGRWPPFPDTVDALRRLRRYYKLVVLSNVDRASLANSIAGPLGGTPFDRLYTAQDVGSYKPARANFDYLVAHVEQDLDVPKDKILHTAQSLFHDHEPAKEVGLASAWIARGTREGEAESIMGGKIDEFEGRVDFTWKWCSMGEMADAVEEAFKSAGVEPRRL